MKIKNHYLKKIAAWLTPHTCILCHQLTHHDEDICQKCYAELPILSQSCQRCAQPLAGAHPFALTCGACLKHPPPFDAAYALFAYDAPVTWIILTLKFQHALVHAEVLGTLLAKKILNTWYHQQSLPDKIIPVPLHPQRLKERGFNQALEIARPIAKILNIPLTPTLCQRTKHTRAQATLPAFARKKNIENAFHTTTDFTGQHIAIIDDVVTTGHTITELSLLLKKAGAARIDIWCCARPYYSLNS